MIVRMGRPPCRPEHCSRQIEWSERSSPAVLSPADGITSAHPLMGGRSVDADAIVVGAGLAGLVAAAELADAGRRVIVLDQEPEGSLGGQAFWSFGGLFFVDSPEQRRLGVRDSRDL